MSRKKHGDRYRVLGLRLKRARKALGLSQTEVGRQVGVSQSTVCRTEIGQREPDLFDINDLITVYGLTFQDLLDPPTEEELATLSRP